MTMRTTMTMQQVPTVERQVDGLIERLANFANEPAARALLIEARRLRSIIENWRTVAPSPQVREETLARVMHLSAAVADVLPPSSTGRSSSSIKATVPFGGAVSPVSVRSRTPGAMPATSVEETVITEGASALPQTPLDVQPVKVNDDLSPHLAMLKDPYSVRADAYRALRHKIAGKGDPKVIGVTSPGRREGKTISAINLAASLREGARGRVLVMEANLRAPSIASTLGFMPPVCFNEQLLRHKAEPLDPWTAAEVLPQLHVMAINPMNKYPPLIDPIAFSIAIDRLRLAGYDYIVVDSPPVLESADVNMISDSVDGFVMTVLARRSDARAVRRAVDQLGAVTFLGTLLLE
ncbi:MAG: CpsD/CapB family tyrosine-protein kinase [Polyangiaceae bacterium]|nr:CpsD/CapB family tyrosine-protein kinase [Polyangiaceae bacterium]